jgi:hypothetical protein
VLGIIYLYVEDINRPLFLNHYKNQLKWIKDLNVRPKTLKVLEENTGQTLDDPGINNYFLNWTPEVLKIRARIDNGIVTN